MQPLNSLTRFADFGMAPSNCMAGADSGTRCSVFCFMVAPGFVHTPVSRSNWSHLADRTSPRRAPVSSRKADDICRVLVVMVGEGSGQSGEFGGAEIAVALGFLISPHAPDVHICECDVGDLLGPERGQDEHADDAGMVLMRGRPALDRMLLEEARAHVGDGWRGLWDEMSLQTKAYRGRGGGFPQFSAADRTLNQRVVGSSPTAPSSLLDRWPLKLGLESSER